jgi:hypothetical protein
MFKDKNGNFRLKIAFDFDDTLTNPLFFDLAKHLIRREHDVWIMTARSSDEQYLEECRKYDIDPISDRIRNADLLETARELGLEHKIIYTSMDDKKVALETLYFDLLFDDEAEWHCNPICEAGGIAVHI